MKGNFECAIVLGFGLDAKGKLPKIFLSRLNKAIELYRRNLFRKIIVAGGLTNKRLSLTEAEAMKRYLIRKGLPSADILKEESSSDTIGNAFFVKKKILQKKKWKRIIIITSDFHVERAKIIFRKVYGRNFFMKFIGTKTFYIPPFFIKRFSPC